MRSIRPPTRGLRAGFAALVGVAALLAATIGPVAAAEPGPIAAPALSGLVTDACTGLPIVAGLSVGLSPSVPVTGEPGPISLPSAQGLGLFTYRTVDPGPIALTVSAPGYISLGADPAVGPVSGGPGVPVPRDPGPISLPPGQGLAVGLLVDIRLAPAYTGGPCKPPNPNFPAIAGRGIDSATGRSLRGLTVGVAPLIADPTTGLKDPGPIQMPSGAPILGLFSFRTRDPGPIAFQFYATAPGHTSLGADPTKPPGPTNLGPGVTVTKDPGPIALPPGSGSVSVSLVLSVALPAGPPGG